MPQDPIGGVIENLLTLQRLGNAASAEAKAVIRSLFDDLAGQIAKLDPTAPQREAYRRQRLEQLLGEVETLVGESFGDIRKTLRTRLADIGAQQAGWTVGQLARSIGSVEVDIKSGRLGAQFMRSILDNDPFQGDTLKGWTDNQKAVTVRRVRRQLQLGMAQNETIDQMVRRVRGTSAGGGRFVGGVMQ
ncbi:MAG TPA: hypothetical protein VLH81_11550, partial [Desulfobacterales bacterium]|nr:hypothetical protein [Desulfobacterales bacterium]